MDMSEFEHAGNSGWKEFASLPLPDRNIPADFNEDDLAFVEELHTAFAPEQEEPPPYHMQTLLGVSDPRLQLVDQGFEQKTLARVFRRLRLSRRLFSGRPPSLSCMLSEMRVLPARRFLFTFTAVLMLFMIVTVIFTSPSFASGLEILLQGTRSGVYQVSNYPIGVHHSTYPLQVDQSGRAKAIYVDGQWVTHGRSFYQWVKGERSELIYQQGGIVFWIAGDQRDGITKDVLMQIANSLRVVNINRSKLMIDDTNSMVQLVADLPMPFASDVLMIFPEDSADGPYLVTAGNDQPTQEKPTQKNSVPDRN